ncbi:MAG: hypothetical protein IKG82_14595 [Oscillospiraceae bacterium]|nr:hypothetical protein [Oscillospiraceae bacterium]
MSFNRFYLKKENISVNTDHIDCFINDLNEQNNYFSKWMAEYKKSFAGLSNDELVEWGIRYYKSVWEMFSACSLYSEAEFNYKQNCYVSFFFDMYYSLLHAMQALIYLSPYQKLNDLFKMSHQKIKNLFRSIFCSKNQMFSVGSGYIIKFFEELKFNREFYSYNTPLNIVTNEIESKLNRTRFYLKTIFQTVSLHFLMIDNSIPSCKITNQPEFYMKFTSFFSNTDLFKLNEKKKMISKKLKYRKKKCKDYLARRSIAIEETKKNPSHANKKKVQILNKKYGEAVEEKEYYYRELQNTKEALERVTIDAAAYNLRHEICQYGMWFRFIIQYELDHLFDEFHTYDSFQYSASLYDFHAAYSLLYDAIMC